MDSRLLHDLKKHLGSDAVLHEPEDLILYEYDGSVEIARPNCVVFPRTKEHILGIVEIANRHKTPIVGRGAGTGLSGGALARRGGILAIFSKMNRILEVDVENQRAIVQPGVRPSRTQGFTSRPIRRARRRARLAETSQKIPVGRTLSPMESQRTTFLSSKWFCRPES